MSPPTFVAVIVIVPFLFIVEPITVSSTFFSTGIDSPVNIDSSMAVIPLIILPSTGIFSPGLTISVSPTCTSFRGIITSLPSFKMRASLACKLNNSPSALVV